MFIYSNLATSLDGKIATASRIQYLLGTPADRKQMQVLRAEADGILIGASTLRAYRKPLLVSDRGQAVQPLNIIMSSALEGVSPDFPFFTEKRVKRLLFVSTAAPKATLRELGKTSEIVVLKPDTSANPCVLQIVKNLEARGLKRLLVEGGGGVMWDFVRHDLIDEFHVTLTPKIIGGKNAPTLVDGEGFSPSDVRELRLLQSRVVGDEIYLVYGKKLPTSA